MKVNQIIIEVSNEERAQEIFSDVSSLLCRRYFSDDIFITTKVRDDKFDMLFANVKFNFRRILSFVGGIIL